MGKVDAASWRCAIFLIVCITLVIIEKAECTDNENSFAPNHAEAVPSFLILGTAKAGTTDLFLQLADEEVNALGARLDPPITKHYRRKEVGVLMHSFCLSDLLLGRKRFRYYLEQLGHPCANQSAEVLRDCVQKVGSREFTMDATPTYLTSPLAPHLLSGLSPLSKVVVMLRDPTGRAESLYNHFGLTENFWKGATLDQLVSTFLNETVTRPAISTTLQHLHACNSASCMADGWRDLVGVGLLETVGSTLVAGGLYRYILAPWRLHYFRPGRAMVIDSHAYYRDRGSVMGQVIRFLYGRQMTSIEERIASATKHKRKNVTSSFKRAGTAPFTTTIESGRRLTAVRKDTLSASLRKQLEDFYRVHVLDGFQFLVNQLRNEGVRVVGFDREPWVS